MVCFGPDSECDRTKLTNHGTLHRKDVKVKKAKIGFLLVTIVSLIVAASMASLASAQQPAAQAKGALRPDGFPVKAPAGWTQKFWDETLGFCDRIAQKARSHKELEEGEIAGSGTCTSLSVEFFSPQGPAPGAYISPDRPAPLPLRDHPTTP